MRPKFNSVPLFFFVSTTDLIYRSCKITLHIYYLSKNVNINRYSYKTHTANQHQSEKLWYLYIIYTCMFNTTKISLGKVFFCHNSFARANLAAINWMKQYPKEIIFSWPNNLLCNWTDIIFFLYFRCLEETYFIWQITFIRKVLKKS